MDIRDKALAMVLANTRQHRGPCPKASKLSAKAQAVKEFLDSDDDMFECQTHNVAKLASILLGEKIVLKKPDEDDGESFDYKPYTVVVFTKNTNSHNYGIGKPALLVGSFEGRALRVDGTEGNEVPDGDENDTRYATDDEVRSFIKALPEKAMKEFFGFLEYMSTRPGRPLGYIPRRRRRTRKA